MELGVAVQKRASKLFSSYFTQELINREVVKLQEWDSRAVESFLRLLHSEADQLHIPFKQHATQFVIEMIPFLLCPPAEGFNSKFFLATVNRLGSEGHLHTADIHHNILSFPDLIPPKLTMQLDSLGILSFPNYFQSCVPDAKKSVKWIKLLFKLICHPNDEDDHFCCVYLLSSLVILAHSEAPAELKVCESTVKTAGIVINSTVRKVWDFLLSNPDRTVDSFKVPANSLPLYPHFELQSYQKCYLELIAFLISYKPEIKAGRAIATQQEWTYFQSPKSITHFITQLLVPLEFEKVLDKLDDILNRYEINWKTLLLVVSTVQICYPSGNRGLKNLVASLLERAFDHSHAELLLASFLLSRQLNAESTSSTHYGTWFASITSSSTSAKQFAFLMSFLNNIVRHEPIWTLKAHKNNPPTIPMVDNCRELWSDYAALVRTRIADLTTKDIAGGLQDDSKLIEEVETAISSYGKNRKLPNSVIEAAIFRKPYFVNKFIPTLLKPRKIPIPNDVREDFVDDLRRSGKLPQATYESYVEACRSLAENPSTEEMEWQTGDSGDDFRNVFDRIATCGNAAQRSLLFEKMISALPKVGAVADTTVIDMDPDKMDLANSADPMPWKIVEGWIDTFASSSADAGDRDASYHSFLLLCPHPPLVRALYDSVWKFVNTCEGSSCQIERYATVIYLLICNGHLLLPVRDPGSASPRDFVDFLAGEMNLRTAKSIVFQLQLLSVTVSQARIHDEMDKVSKFALLYRWVQRRVRHSDQMTQHQKYLQYGDDLCDGPRSNKMPVEQWLRLELCVESDNDVLQWAERTGYLHSILEADYSDTPDLPAVILGVVARQAAKGADRRTCAQDLLHLLQSYVTTGRPAAAESPSPWLVQLWQQLRSELGANIDLVMWNLVCSLPVHLLTRNTAEQPIRETSLQSLVTLIETHWRNSTVDGAWLPKHVTSYLVRALKGSKTVIPCLQFSKQVHETGEQLDALSSPWNTLDRALKIFNPRHYPKRDAGTIQWSHNPEVDALVVQLVAVAATVHFAESCQPDWPWIVKTLGSHIAHNPTLLKALAVRHWANSLLPWREILPTIVHHLLPLVVLHVMLTWSRTLMIRDLSTSVEYLEVLTTAHGQWLKTVDSFVESLSSCGPKTDYPAGKLLDLGALGRLTVELKDILKLAPPRAIKQLRQSNRFEFMDGDLQATVKQLSS